MIKVSLKLQVCDLKKRLFLVAFFGISASVFAQIKDTIVAKNLDKMPVHSFGISYCMGTYFPEKVYDKIGLIEQRPTANFGNEIALNYTIIFLGGLGFSSDFVLGFMPDGTGSTSNGNIPKDTVWYNGYKGDPTKRSISNGFGVFYSGFNLKFNYLFKATNHLLIQPELGIKTVYYANSFNASTESFCDKNNGQCVDYFFPYVTNDRNVNNNTNYNVKRFFYPDLICGVNFFVYPRNPRHCIRIGLNLNYSFVPRLEGYYDVKNLGEKYNSSGKVQYTSTHIGITIGYQFFSKMLMRKIFKNDRYLFNPRM